PLTYETVIADKKLVREFRLKNPGREDVFKNLINSQWMEFSQSSDYMRVLFEGNISLLIHQRVKKVGEVAEFTSDGPKIRTKLKPDPVYYLFTHDNRSFLIRRFNNRTLNKIFPKNKEEVRQAFRSTHGRPQKDSERTELIKNLELLIFNNP
ncbi:MAG: hypothetical protein K0B09_07530, partial [Bacteroidales bacterium]|nr:hypothetical protein [Bacteroidales bacterium]